MNVYTLSYPAPVSNWLGTAMPLEDRAVNVLEAILGNCDLASGRLNFVCHSLGGLVVKQVLREAAGQSAPRPEVAVLLRRIKTVVFLATPHTGSAQVGPTLKEYVSSHSTSRKKPRRGRSCLRVRRIQGS